jgi:hypothetical protein
MYQIDRATRSPQDMREHRHRRLIQDTISQITGQEDADLPMRVHIWKVNSHIGVIGNEYADAIAVAVAKDQVRTLGTDIEREAAGRAVVVAGVVVAAVAVAVSNLPFYNHIVFARYWRSSRTVPARLDASITFGSVWNGTHTQ